MMQDPVRTLILKKGSAVKGLQDPSPLAVSDPVQAARDLTADGAQVLLVLDQSEGDVEHDEALTLLRQMVRAVDRPVWGAGNVKRVEDVKKILYAGCKAALLNWSRDSNRAMLQEVSGRFGREKIAVCIRPGTDEALTAEDLSQIRTWAGRLIELREDGTAVLVPGQTDGNFVSLEWDDLKKGPDGLVTVVVQDFDNDEVLMVAYMNEEAFAQTLRTGRMTYWSRSRQALWIKGETSGHFQTVKELRIDCDNDTLLARVDQVGVACHTGNRSCFYRTLVRREAEPGDAAPAVSRQNASPQSEPARTNPLTVLEDVYAVIEDRRRNPKEGSYTNYLFEKGLDKILKKCGEEAAEIIIAAKNPNPEEIKYEIADFLYHMMVLMAERGISWEEIAQELANRE